MPLIGIGAGSRVVGIPARALIPTARGNIGTLGDDASRGTTGARVAPIASEMFGTLHSVKFVSTHTITIFRGTMS